MFVAQQLEVKPGQLTAQSIALILDPEYAPGRGIKPGQALSVDGGGHLAQLEPMAGRLAVVGAHGLPGLRLEHQAQGLGGQARDQFFGVAVIGHDDHRQLLVWQYAQLRGKIIAAATVLVSAHAGATGSSPQGARNQPRPIWQSKSRALPVFCWVNI